MAKLDEVNRKRLWQDEKRIVCCDRHIIGICGIEKVHEIRKKIECGMHNCVKQGAYEVEMSF